MLTPPNMTAGSTIEMMPATRRDWELKTTSIASSLWLGPR